MSAGYRFRCGHCRYRTTWLTESDGVEQHWQHYAVHHPDIAPRGRIETRQARTHEGVGCLAVVGGLLLLLVIVASCQHPRPDGLGAPSKPTGSAHPIDTGSPKPPVPRDWNHMGELR